MIWHNYMNRIPFVVENELSKLSNFDISTFLDDEFGLDEFM